METLITLIKMALIGKHQHGLDRKTSASTQNDVSDKTLKELCNSIRLVYIWRQMHINKLQFTYKDISRIDKFLASENCTNCILQALITPAGIKTDHKAVFLNILIDERKKGPDTWKMNVSLTEDKNYIKTIKEFIRKTKKKIIFHNQNKCCGKLQKFKSWTTLYHIVKRSKKIKKKSKRFSKISPGQIRGIGYDHKLELLA